MASIRGVVAGRVTTDLGRLFANEDPSELAAAIVSVMTDAGLRSRLVAEADSRVREFDWDVVVDDVIAVYDSVRLPGEKVTEDLRGQIMGRLSRSGVRGGEA